MFKHSSRMTTGRALNDPQLSAYREANNDPRIGRAWRDGKLIFCALVDHDVVQSDDILAVYQQLPALDAA